MKPIGSDAYTYMYMYYIGLYMISCANIFLLWSSPKPFRDSTALAQPKEFAFMSHKPLQASIA